MKRLTIAHAADFHLSDKPSGSYVGMGEGIWQATTGLFNIVKQEGIELLLLAGDIFDVPLPSESTVRRFKQLIANCSRTHVCVCAGNHDPATIYSPWLCGAWPDNFHLLTPTQTEIVLPELDVTVFGVSFVSQTQTEPIEMPSRKEFETAFAIWLQHGDIVKQGQKSIYQPLLVTQVESAEFDYIALGHVHRQNNEWTQGCSSRYRYAGSLSGRGFDECGFKGFWLGHLDFESGRPARPDMRFVKLNGSRFEIIHLELASEEQSDYELIQSLRRQLQSKIDEHNLHDEEHLYLRVVLGGKVITSLTPLLPLIRDDFTNLATYVEVKDETQLALSYSSYVSDQSVLGVYAKSRLSNANNEISEIETKASSYGFRALLGEDLLP